MKAATATYKIIYNSKDITRDISDHLISLSYTDKVEGEADELEITVDDKDGLWQNDWYPEKGATIEAQIEDNGLTLPCGKFTIDEISFTGSRDGGDIITISCVAASITKKLRTKKITAHENKSLKQLAESVALHNGLKVQGKVPDIRFARVTQNRETDLAFLNRIGNLYGVTFSVRDKLLIFQSRKDIESKAHVFSIDKTDAVDFTFTDKSEKVFKKAKVRYHNPETNQTIEHTEISDADYTGGEDELEIKTKAENKQQAELIAQSNLSAANKREQTGSISLPGHVLLLSGSNIEATGFGKNSGIYHITESTHSISGDSYTTSFESKKVNKIPAAKYKPKAKPKNSSSKPSSILTGPKEFFSIPRINLR